MSHSHVPLLTTFSIFSQLPPELRHLVWSHALVPTTQMLSSHETESMPIPNLIPGQAVVTPVTNPIPNSMELAGPSLDQPAATVHQYPLSSTTLPSLLQVNRESRHEVLRQYKLFPTSHASRETEIHTRRHQIRNIYINPQIDTLILHGSIDYLGKAIAHPALYTLRFLKCVTSGVEAPGILVDKVGECLKNLKRFELVVGREELEGFHENGSGGQAEAEGQWFCMDFGFGRSFSGGGKFVWIEDGRYGGIWGGA